jgi:aminobenzoyl-glutamate utilization protein B
MKWAAIMLLSAGMLWAQGDDRAALLSRMDSRAEVYGKLSRQIWEFAEVGYKETKSSNLLKTELRSNGFEIRENVAGISTAFMATWGQGKPVIAFMGEYDALPGLSQHDAPQRQPRAAGEPGHGCGHNLFGVAAAFAAISAKEYMEQRKLPGTIRFLGTPAEEGGGGKIYMIRAGAFDGADVAVTWHPGDRNQAGLQSTLANISGKFRFHGLAAHAAAAPDAGRSALDGLLLMNHCTDMLREHVPQETRIHYIITSGGAAPNVVPDFAEAFYYARQPSMPVLDNIWSRIQKCADAGALGSETRVEMTLINSVYNLLPNDALAALFDKNLRRVGGVKYTPEEQAFAQELAKSFTRERVLPLGSQEAIQPMAGEGLGGGSTDVADVSWVLPTGQFTTATFVPGTPGHSWQSTACAGSSIGRKGMLAAAKVLTLTTLDLVTDPKQIEAARASFEKRRAGHTYRSRLPADAKPPLTYRDKPE